MLSYLKSLLNYLLSLEYAWNMVIMLKEKTYVNDAM